MTRKSPTRKSTRQRPQNLSPKSAQNVKGGIKLENVRITSYQLGALDNDG